MTDSVTLAVIRGRLEQIVDEMDAALFRAAFSPVIAEARDGSHGIYHAETAATIAMGKNGLPVFIGAMRYATQAALERARADGGPKEGDIYLLNDPYVGATHLNDIKLIKPYFRGCRHLCNLASVGHWADVGGNVAGNYNPTATEIMQEGFRVPPVKLADGGTINQDIVNMLLTNSRLPDSAYGDFNAQLGALELGERRLNALFDEYGDNVVLSAMDEFHRRAAAQMRALIADLPDGTYSFEDSLDNDGIDDRPLRIALTVTIDGDEMTLDFTGSSPACIGPMSVARATTVAACFVGLKHLFPEVPANDGCLEPIRFVIPENSILWVEAPHPVSGYTENILRTVDVIFGAFAQVAPERSNAACFATVNVLLLSGRRDDGSNFILFTFHGGGLGGNPESDGLSHGNAPIGMANIPPAEILEAAFPVYFTNWGLRRDSGGPGMHRGGLGCVYEAELLADTARMTAFGERALFPAFGIVGGSAGAPNRISFGTPGAMETPKLGAKVSGITLKKGQRVRFESPGGGGYGPPTERPVEKIARDIALDLVSREAAEREYGVTVAADGSVRRGTV